MMKKFTNIIFVAALNITLLAVCDGQGIPGTAAQEESRLLCDQVESPASVAGAPKASDVIMRSLRLRPINAKEDHDTMQALRDFHATTLAWAYIDNQEFIAKVKQSGRSFGGAASAPSYRGPKDGDDWLKDLAIVNRRGEVIIAPWKRTWKPTLWGCVNNPRLQSGYHAYLKRYLDAGAQVMQRDEPGGNRSAVRWGGCFCGYCMEGFREYLANRTTPQQRQAFGIGEVDTFDYRTHLDRANAPIGDAFGAWNGGRLKELFLEFQTEMTIAFHRRARSVLDAHAGHHVLFSCNNGVRHWSEIELEFDWAFGELAYSHATASELYRAMGKARDHDRVQIVTMPKKGDRLFLDQWTRLTRRTIAMAYACGGHCMVPWDVYMPRDAPRYFGTPGQYADLFGFVRANRDYFDGYRQAEAAGHGVPVEQRALPRSVHLVGGQHVHVNVRARPGNRQAPVVIQLVDWAPRPRPFKLVLDPSRFFGDAALKIRLLRPAVYDKAAHESADRTADYAALSQEILLAEGRRVAVDIPPLDPWGIVLVERSSAADAGRVWQPAVRADPRSRFRNELIVHVDCSTPEAAIHYTLDGKKPDRTSPRYTSPIRLTKSTEIRAVASTNMGTSPEARGRFTRVGAASNEVVPDAAPLKSSLALWLSADSLSGELSDRDSVSRWPARVGPAATVPTSKLLGGGTAAPPSYRQQALGGRAAVSFDGVDDQLFVESFANEYLAASPLTIFMVTQSDTPHFGICGNSATGGGGVPRLYLTRNSFRYNDLYTGLEPTVADGVAAISVFAHDGQETISAWVNGDSKGSRAGIQAVAEFGGGHLAMPFRSGNRGQRGKIAEILVYTSKLTDSERHGIESWLADRYGIPVRRWQ